MDTDYREGRAQSGLVGVPNLGHHLPSRYFWVSKSKARNPMVMVSGFDARETQAVCLLSFAALRNLPIPRQKHLPQL
eukprot:21539-Amphidinium_carterae.1